MRATCVINNYNYRPYVAEAIDSALQQTRPFDRIVVVDDGSTDGSQELLRAQYGADSRILLLLKSNGGQLSSFNQAASHITGDLVFFLDADDRFRPSYLAEAIDCYKRTGVDFLFAGYENFGAVAARSKRTVSDRDWGFSTLTALLEGTWIGGPTSCLSMQSTLALRILPCPLESQWRIQADNVLVYGASIFGGRKYQLGRPLVDRRVHGANLYFGRDVDHAAAMRFELAKNGLLAWCAQRAGYDLASLPRLLSKEFRSLQQPTFKEYRRYLRMARQARLPTLVRTRLMLSITAHYLSRRQRPSESLAPETDVPQTRRAA